MILIFDFLKFTRAAACLSLLLLGLTAHSQLNGNVYKDFDSNGSRSLPNEIGVRNVLVSAFVGTSTTPVTTRTNTLGQYFFTVSQIPTGSKVRVEFTDLGISNSGKKGTNSGSSVQFVTGGSENVDLGLISNEEYCGLDGLELFASCYVNGDPLKGGTAGEDASLVLFPYTANGLAGTGSAPYPTMLAKAKEIGAVWGTDYQRSTKIAITSSIVRRHSGLGPLGTGGIYKIDFNTNVASPLVDVKTLGIDTGPIPHVGLPADMLIPNEDSLTVHAVGKRGIGGITLSKDEKTLFMVNLYDRKVYSFLVGKPANTPSATSVRSYPIPDPCGDGDYRPWAIKQYGSKLYVGVVCTAETSQDSTKLKAVIYELDPVSGVFTKFFEFPMSYKKGPLDHTGACINYTYWKPWIDRFPDGCASFFDGTHKVNFAMYPMALLTDIEFDGDGSILVSFMDRTGLMAGFRNMRPKDNGQRYDGFVGGDILRIYNNNGTYQLENNGIAGDRTGSGVDNKQGPGGGEFYGNDVWIFKGNPAHSEIANGGMMLLPGTGEVVVSTMDPVNEIYQSAGMRVFSNFDGSMKRGYALYSDRLGTLGKSGGAGDFKAACTDAPIEIGNRLWHDADFDGIQDPDEAGIDGVEVELFDMDNGGISVGKTITKNGGIYCFSDANVTGGLLPERKYKLRVCLNNPILLAQKFFNISPKDVNSGTNSDLRDSDADLISGCLEIPFTTGLAGETNHALDFGLIKCEPVNAGTDLTLCQPTSSADLFNATSAQKWMYLSGPGTAAIDTTTGVVTGMITPGVYKFMLFYRPAGLNCSDTLSITIKQKPNAGTDLLGANGFCSPISKTKLNGTPTGGAWTAIATNPATTTIDATGNVSGMSVAGIYEFIYSLNGCADSVKVEIKLKPNAGTDQSYCFPKQTTKLTATPAGGIWSAMATNPAVAIVDANGNVLGMTNTGIYQFIYTLNGCADSVKVEIKLKPNSGSDLLGTNALCLPVNNLKITGTPTGGAWTLPATNPEALTVDAAGNVSSITKSGIFEFIYTLPNACVDTLKVQSRNCALSSLGNFVWYDRNKNGIQDNRTDPITKAVLGPEFPVKGAIIKLMNGTTNAIVAIDTTDANGLYKFNDLLPGDYYIMADTASLPVDYGITFPDQGSDDTIDSDVNAVTNKSIITNLVLQEEDLTWDFGIFKGAKPSITDPCVCNNELLYGLGFDKYVYNETIEVKGDVNDRWVITNAKDRITGYQTKGILLPAPPDGFPAPFVYNPAKPVYLIEDSPGHYKLDFFHYDKEGYEIVVTNGVDTLSIKNLCYNAPKLTDNLIQSHCPNDQTVYQLQKTFPTGTAKYYFLQKGAFKFTSGDDGIIDISKLTEISSIKPSDYADKDTIALLVDWIPNGTQPIAPNGKPFTTCVVGTIYNIAFSINLAGCQRGSLGDFVWKDKNKNGLQDTGESGVYNVKVDLFKNGTLFATTNTDAAGKYLFSNLTAGTYKIKVASSTIPLDCKISSSKDAGDDTKDSDISPTTGESGDYVINPEDPTKRHILTVDAGLEPICKVICIAPKPKKIRQ
jgi:hypothetical protein